MKAPRARFKFPFPAVGRGGEGEVIKGIVDGLNRRGHFCWRQNTGAMKMPDAGRRRGFRFVKFGAAGVSDILGVALDGRMLALEVKTGKTAATAAQRAFVEEVKKRGGRAGVVRDFAAALAVAEK